MQCVKPKSRMAANNISKLIKLADSLVYEKSGKHLTQREKNILRQSLTGKKNSSTELPGLTKNYVRSHLIPELWDLLSDVLGEEVSKRNVLTVLQDYLQRTQPETASQSKALTNTQAKLNGAAFNGSVSWPGLTNRFFMSKPDSVKAIEKSHQSRLLYCISPNCTNRQNPNHQNSCQACDTPLLVDGHLHEPSQADGKKVEDGSSNFTVEEPQPFSQTSQPDNTGETKSSTDGLPTLFNLINFLKPGRALLLSLGVLGCLFGWSWLANWYGVTNHLRGQLSQAEFGYSWALKFNPLSATAHYNQGGIYEDQQNYKRAHAEYQLAIEGGLVEAYNNQARLYILEGNYDAATSLLRIGLPLTKAPQVKASMYKNLGWAGLEQGDLAPARFYLTQAIKLKSDFASPFCLLAQLMEREGDEKGALVRWQNCLAFNAQELPEEAKWYFEARKRLEAPGAE